MCTGAMVFRDGFRKARLTVTDIDFDVDERTVQSDNRAAADLGEHRCFSVVQGSLDERGADTWRLYHDALGASKW